MEVAVGWQEIATEVRELWPEGEVSRIAHLVRRALRTAPQDADLHLQLGRIAIDRVRLDEAERHFTRAAELAPNSPDPHGWLVAVLHWRNDYPAALAAVRAARERWPEDVGLRAAQARLHNGLGDYPAALAITEPVPPTAPAAEKALEWRLVALRALHRHPEAEELAREFLRDRPEATDVWDELVRALRGQGRWPEAQAESARLLARFPRRLTAILTHADTLQQSGQAAAAIAFLSEQVRARPHLRALRYGLGRMLAATEDHLAAAAQYAMAIRLSPDLPANWWLCASSLREAGELAAAREVLTHARRRLPREADIITEQAELVEAESDAAAALPIAESALGIDPADLWTPRLVARLHRESGQPEEAERRLLELREKRPHDDECLRALGWHLRMLDREEEVPALYRAELARTPSNVDVALALGVVLRRLDRTAEAIAVVRECLTHRPEHAELWLDLGRSLESQGDHEAAESAYRTATELSPHDADTWYFRIGHLLGRDRHAEAEPLVAAALRHCPDSAKLHRRRTRILQVTSSDEVTVAAMRAAAERFPGEADLAIDLVRHLSWSGRHAEALSEVDRRLAADPRNEDLWYWRIQQLISLNRRAAARAAAVTAHRELPESARLAFLHAWSLIEIDQEVAAEAALTAAHEAHPADQMILRGLVRCLRRLDRCAETEPILRAALATDPDAIELHLELAWTLEQQFRFEEAVAGCDHALSLDAEHTEAFGGALRLRYQLGRAEEAERLIAEATSRRPRDAALWQEIATARLTARRLDEAVTAARAATEHAPGDPAHWALLARTLLQAGRPTEAARAAEDGVRLHPTHSLLRYRQVEAARAQGREAEAETLLRATVADLPGNSSVAIDLAVHLRRHHRHEEALALLAGVRDRDPDNHRPRWHRVRVLRAARRFAEARTEVDRALERFPWSTDLRVQHARLLVREGRIEAALAAYTEIEAADPVGADPLSGRLECLVWLGRHEEAIRELRAGARAHPDRESLRLEVVWMEQAFGRVEEALAELDLLATQLEPSTEQVRARARILLDRKQFAEAAETVAAGLRQFPADTGLMLLQGTILDGRNRYAEALDCFDRLLAVDPLSVGAATAKSATLRSLGRFREARQLMEAALTHRPTQPELLAERGWVHRDQGRLSLARKDFDALLELAANPDERVDALRGLGWVAFADGDFAEAETRFRAAIAVAPLDIAATAGLAWTLVRGGELEHEEEAERLCLAILARDPVNLLAHTCAGVLYARQRDYPLAEHHLRRTVDLDPYNGSYVDLGALLAQLERFEEAEELFGKALARDFYDAQAHIELGSLLLQRDQDNTEPGADARAAAQHFRQALLCEPRSGSAAIGLALALARSPGDLVAAERVLREALDRADCDSPAWRLRLTLAKLLLERGDATQRREFHLEALALAQQAISAATAEAEPYFVAGVAAFKIGENGSEVQARPAHRRRAVRFLRRCLERDPGHTEARRLVELATHSLAVARRSLVGSVALVSVATGLLLALWTGFFLTDKVTTVVLGTLTPVLTGLVALGFVLPLLVKLKLPGGVEADLSASMNQLSAGPTGELSYGPGRLVGHRAEGRPDRSLNAGPRGELPRLE